MSTSPSIFITQLNQNNDSGLVAGTGVEQGSNAISSGGQATI